MQRVVLPDFDLPSLIGSVGPTSYAKGAEYAARRAVAHVQWNASERALSGVVRGSNGNLYATSAYFSLIGGRPPAFDHGECSCPVGVDCKHAVALVLTGTVTGTAQSAAGQAALRTRPAPEAWQRSLDSLLGPMTAPASRETGMPLGVELTLSGDGSEGRPRYPVRAASRPQLQARLVRPGKNGGWVAGGLHWGKLESLRYYSDHPESHVRLLRELYALYLSARDSSGYYSYGYDVRSIELSAIDSPQLWPLLDEAESVGLQFVHERKLGPVRRYRDAELCLDVTRTDPSGPLTIAAAIRAEGAPPDAAPVTFIGAKGHGIVGAEPAGPGGAAGGRRFWLARLVKPAPPQLQQMALAGRRLDIPAAEEPRFRSGYYPRLRRTATVISSDDSYAPPAISGPDLILHPHYGPDHELEVTWEWSYQVDDVQLRTPLDPAAPDDGFRDTDGERALLASLDQLPLHRFGLLRLGAATSGSGGLWKLASPVRLAGMETMRFTTELLPLLDGQPGIIAEITGDPADYREAGDSLRIAVSTDAVPGETDWFDLGVSVTVEGRVVPFIDIFLALSRGEPHLLLPDGAYFSLLKPELQTLARLIEEARALQDLPGGPLQISRYQAGLWDELAALGVVDHQAAAWRDQVQGLLAADGVGRADPPPGLAAQLRPYQADGFGWLAFLWKHKLGGILADDMGLGKTLQSLALIAHAKAEDPGIAPFLIVAPTSVVPNWAAEAARFTPGLNVVTISETGSRRRQPLGELVAGADVVVTSYTLLRIDFESYQELSWSALLLDEAQNVKNRQSKIHQCARRLPAPVKVAITGTPMENNVMELWSLLSVTAPGLFPNPAWFRDYYAKPIEKDQDAALLAQLQRRIRPLVKRRTKEQVITDLPPKQEQILEVDLHPQHRKLYQTHLQRERQKVLGLIDDMNSNRFMIFRSLTLLRQLSLHAGLIDDEHADLASSKIDTLVGQLENVTAGGHRALVFSQFTGFLGKVRDRLEREGIPYCYLDGKTRDRAAVLRRFKEGDAPVFLISLKAGGFGLNLTEADYCFLLDPWWNPATETQAVDRTHRIGQTRNVMVYRLVAKDTIEEKVMALKARKAELFSSVLDEGNVFGATLNADDIRGLFS
jgi:superfamily II DNA or RNA helicase